MTAILVAIGALLGYVLCMIAACRLAIRESSRGLPPATARALRRQRRALRAVLPGDRVAR